MGLSEEFVVRELLRNQSKLVAFAWTLLRDPHQADDLFQDVCLEAICKRAEIHDETHLLPWAMQAVRFRAIDLLRANRRHHRILSEQVVDRLQASWQAVPTVDKQRTEALRDCVSGLSGYAKQLVKLRYVDGLAGKDVAKRLNRKVETVYKALSRVHKTLEECVRRQLDKEQTDG
ncbi:MAG: sigma-70 family RNA polymerase sigma factor [Pirellulales bacterium]